MSLTPNYSFIIPTGSDAVNLLTQCYPNFTSLDSILKPIQESGVTPATDTKVGTVHQLVRTDSSCNMFRFIATANYASGDTFTVDGASVTATAMDGTALSAGAFVINQSVVCILNNLVLTVLVSGKETTSLPASAVTYDNSVSGLTATDVQNAIDEVVSMIPATPIDHGLYELWANPDPTLNFSDSTITINNFDHTKYDAVEIEWSLYASEVFGAEPVRYEKSALVGNVLTARQSHIVMDTSEGKIWQGIRQVVITLDTSAHTLAFAFDHGHMNKINTFGTASTDTVDDSKQIPIRILGLVHNS